MPLLRKGMSAILFSSLLPTSLGVSEGVKFEHFFGGQNLALFYPQLGGGIWRVYTPVSGKPLEGALRRGLGGSGGVGSGVGGGRVAPTYYIYTLGMQIARKKQHFFPIL